MESKIHNYKKRLERTMENVKNSNLSLTNKKIINEFRDNCLGEGLSICKTERYIYDMKNLAKILDNDLDKATKEDLRKVVADIELKEWSPHTKHSFKVAIRKIYKFIDGITERGVYPERVRWLRTSIKNCNQKLPNELLTEEEIKSMINNCKHKRDKALISVLYETGSRISEIGHLKINDIIFDEYGARLTILGKTGARVIRIVASAPYLLEWINSHPSKEAQNSFVWVKFSDSKILGYGGFCSIVKNAAKRAGINKRIYNHLFRHSRATFLAGYLTEAQMKVYLGWAQSSKMAGIYVHLNGKDTDNAILELNGVKPKEKPEVKSKPFECIRCKAKNEFTNKFCRVCGIPLEKEEANKIIKADLDRSKADEIMNKLVEDPEILELIKKKLNS